MIEIANKINRSDTHLFAEINVHPLISRKIDSTVKATLSNFSIDRAKIMPRKKQFLPVLSYNNQRLAVYQYQVQQQTQLLKAIQKLLPSSLASHILHCVIAGKKISLYTDSAVWASQLRFYQPTILHNLAITSEKEFEKLQIKIIPPTTKPHQKNTKQYPSAGNIKLILDVATQQSDDELANALLKLGKTLQKHQDR